MIRPKGIWTSRVVVAALVLAFTAVSASAYTIVMRDGRRVSIPDEFTVTNSTVTYEVGSGIQISIQLASVNVAATERANGEAVGSFLARANAPAPQPAAASAPAQGRSKADRSITNADLEGYKRARLASEKAYEQRRKQLGLPSREQQRLDMAAVEARTQAQLRNMRGQDQAGEAYWRERASALRSEIAVNDAQLEFVRARLSELPETNSPFDSTSPFGYPTVNGPFGYPGSNYPVWNPFPGNRRSNRVYNRRFPRGQWPVFIPPAQNDRSEERATLTNQLNDLLMQRAALGVRWKELEEEARRAGAYPGWLRP
jgi:hypothetical protein